MTSPCLRSLHWTRVGRYQPTSQCSENNIFVVWGGGVPVLGLKDLRASFVCFSCVLKYSGLQSALSILGLDSGFGLQASSGLPA